VRFNIIASVELTEAELADLNAKRRKLKQQEHNPSEFISELVVDALTRDKLLSGARAHAIPVISFKQAEESVHGTS
jgi:rRNA-processing protein FCF1